MGFVCSRRILRSTWTTNIKCSERPRFYLFDLKDLLACDPLTPVGKACIQ